MAPIRSVGYDATRVSHAEIIRMLKKFYSQIICSGWKLAFSISLNNLIIRYFSKIKDDARVSIRLRQKVSAILPFYSAIRSLIFSLSPFNCKTINCTWNFDLVMVLDLEEISIFLKSLW